MYSADYSQTELHDNIKTEKKDFDNDLPFDNENQEEPLLAEEITEGNQIEKWRIFMVLVNLWNSTSLN